LKDKDTYEEYVIDWANEIKLTKKLRTELVELITDSQYELNAY
jgi:hypothetical protein